MGKHSVGRVLTTLNTIRLLKEAQLKCECWCVGCRNGFHQECAFDNHGSTKANHNK